MTPPLLKRRLTDYAGSTALCWVHTARPRRQDPVRPGSLPYGRFSRPFVLADTTTPTEAIRLGTSEAHDQVRDLEGPTFRTLPNCARVVHGISSPLGRSAARSRGHCQAPPISGIRKDQRGRRALITVHLGGSAGGQTGSFVTLDTFGPAFAKWRDCPPFRVRSQADSKRRATMDLGPLPPLSAGLRIGREVRLGTGCRAGRQRRFGRRRTDEQAQARGEAPAGSSWRSELGRQPVPMA